MDDDKEIVDTVYHALPPLFEFSEDSGTSDSSRSGSQHAESPRDDWALLGTACSRDAKSLDGLENFGMDWSALDIDTHISAFISDPSSMDPNTLFTASDSMFQFTLASPDVAPQPSHLPTSNDGSTSSRSASPVHDSTAGVNPSDLSLFTKLGQKARDAAGVMLAIPAEQSQPPISPISPTSIPPSKMPIPRLRPSNTTSAPLPATLLLSSTAPVKHPTLPASVPAFSPPAVTGKAVRPKTSHTTIERRYRTNLNARILALRRAVPALRILEKNSPTQTQGRGLTGATAPMWDFNDVVNERGYVDGVKAAKKNSKGVVLGKAVEYIRALKRRETRLRREADGMRALLSGLVGGPELLREWECEWRARFGGEEADEVDEDEDDADIDVEGDYGAEDDSDEEDARAKKRARVTKPAAPPVEKRKRGRPRKHPAPTPVPKVPGTPIVAPAAQVPPAPVPASKTLLALALIFSIFHPKTSPAGHTGAVLTPAPETQASRWSALQILHILVFVLLFASLMRAYLPRYLTGSFAGSRIPVHPPSMSAPKNESREERNLRAAVGAKGGVRGVICAAIMCVLRMRMRGDLSVWRRVGEIDALRGTAAPLLSRVQTYLALAAHAPRAPADSITLALLAHAFAPSSAAAHWADARRAENSTAAEKLVLDMDMDDAAHILAATSSSSLSSGSSDSSNTSDSEADDDRVSSPVRLIATHAVLARAKDLAADIFVSTVIGGSIDGSGHATALHAAGSELGGEPAVLTRLLERVARCLPGDVLPMLEADADTDEETDANIVSVLLRATMLFRRVFPTTAVPGHWKANSPLHLELRRVLASPAFEISVETEDARDRVVDLLAEARQVR